jgi:hypothetical protein
VVRRRIHACNKWLVLSLLVRPSVLRWKMYEEEDTCVPYEEEGTCIPWVWRWK